MSKDRYIFPAIFDYADDGISIEFPDLPGCLPSAHDTEEALKNAREAMGLHLWGMEVDAEDIPEATPVTRLHPQPNQVVVLVDVWMPAVREHVDGRAVKKTLSIPKWLNDMAEREKVNFSHVLQSALKNYLGVNQR
ncbi:MAG TPA: type II toxin-antitoxin system HicB family antitoxin [Spirochaetia bacterium]|nr:type II toxin-antitoxin system HicB family antitoxin [Spirochaetia bacterium]